MALNQSSIQEIDELVINWHLTGACNYRCQYCFAKWDKPDVKAEVWRDHYARQNLIEKLFSFFSPSNLSNPLRKNLRWTSVRLSLVGGEPTLLGDQLVNITNLAQSVGFQLSLITNGSKPEVIAKLSKHLDVLALSLDSIDAETNSKIGRTTRSAPPLPHSQVQNIILKARSSNPTLQLKINTVVNSANFSENFKDTILSLQPDRWKVMRALSNVSKALEINDEEFNSFLVRHHSLQALISTEDNIDMKQSYIMVDPYGRFFQNGTVKQPYTYSTSIVKVGALKAFNQIPFSPEAFSSRYSASNIKKCA